MNTSQKLAKLRSLMQQHHLDFYVVPGADPHQNEYVSAHWQRRSFISGFTGSNGDAIIGIDEAYLFTDGRYTLQAKLELDPKCFTLFEYPQGQASSLNAFLVKHAVNKRVGVDPSTLTSADANKLIVAFASINAELVFTSDNLIDAFWEERPAINHAPAFAHPLNFSGVDVSSKLKALRAYMQEESLQYVALNEPTIIAWLFNIRGHDAADTPIIFSYALVSLTDAQIYIDEQSWTPDFKEYCQDSHLQLLPYAQFYPDLALLKDTTVGLDIEANALMGEALRHNKIKNVRLPMTLARACKNQQELQGIIDAHIEDAVALVRFFAWLENHWQGQTEVSASDKLFEFRKQGPNFFSLSFPTIAGFKDHGAIIHYRAEPKTAHKLGNDGLFLLDSGGQYVNGTTDVTRTLHLGTPTAFEKECYTLVLKGHLALGNTPFPHGTRGEQLDGLARQFLWQQGYNYAHGTGHGVGAFLNVHEGPHRISTGATTTALMPNMITSNEPGVYFEGQFGIRIENLCYVKLADIESKTGHTFYVLENLTLVPYARHLIDVARLSADEINWVNAYHQRIFDTLAPRLDAETKAWLAGATKAL
jgi:Xaa-Pro aminopeptidase